jgi:hypothetical protein
LEIPDENIFLEFEGGEVPKIPPISEQRINQLIASQGNLCDITNGKWRSVKRWQLEQMILGLAGMRFRNWKISRANSVRYSDHRVTPGVRIFRWYC